jgi:hypothetical protein
MSPGAYPDVSVDEARAAALEARKLAKAGTNPAAVKRAERAAQYVAQTMTFGKVAAEFLALDDIASAAHRCQTPMGLWDPGRISHNTR